MEFRERTIGDFGIIFGDDSTGDEEVVTDQFSENWAWFGILHRLTGGDITKLETITKTSEFECLTWLTYEEEIKEQQKFNKNE